MAGLKIPISVQLGNSLQNLKSVQQGFNNTATSVGKARAELNQIIAVYGKASPQAQAAAEKVNQLNENIKAGRQLTRGYNLEGKFQLIGGAIQGAVGAMNAIIGAQAVFGSKSKDLEKTLTKVQGALALSQGVTSILAAGEAFSTLGAKAVAALSSISSGIAATGIGLFVVALGLTVAYWDDITKAVGKANGEQERFNSMRESFAEINTKAAKSSAEEVAQLRTLYTISQDNNVSLKTRNQAIDKLQALYPKYFGNLSNEAILAGNAKGAYDTLTNSIIAKARAQAAQGKIAELFSDEDYQAALGKVTTVNDRIERAKKGLITSGEVMAAGLPAAFTQFINTNAGAANLTFKKFQSALQTQNKDAIDLVNKIDAQAKGLVGIYGPEKFVSNVVIDAKDKVKDLQKEVERLDFRKFIGEAKYLELFGGTIERYKFKLEQLQQLKLRAKTTVEIENINKKIEEVQSYLDRAENGVFIPLEPRVRIPSGGLIPKTDKEKAQDEIDKTFGDIFESAAQNGIGSAAEAFGTALADGGDIFAALGQSALTSLGDFAVNVGKELLKIAITFEAIKKAFSSLGAGGKIAVAFALIAVGSAIKASVSKNAKKLATGGFIDGPGTSTSDSIPARLSRGEYVIRARSVSKYGKDFFDKLNRGIPPPEPWRAIVNRSGNPVPADPYRALVNRQAAFREGGYVDPFASYSRALVNRMEVPSIFEPDRSRALVNRPLPQVPTVRTGSVSMSPDNTFGGVIAETRISGQDLKIILSRADRRYSNVT